MSIVKVHNLSRSFGSIKAVDNVSFEINEGEIFGLLGPNGAGKTTTIRMLTGVLRPSQGTVSIGEYSIQDCPIEAKQMMGIVPEMANAYIDISAIQNLMIVAGLYGLKRDMAQKKAEELLKLFGLYEKRSSKVKTFSKGMKQRLILAMALMNDASILFLDEPTSGLDVESTRLIRRLVREFNDQGKTVLLTTHNIEEANLLCDRVAIMNYGQIVAIDKPERLKRTIQGTSSIEVSFQDEVNIHDLDFKEVKKVKKMGDKFRLYTEKTNETIYSLVSYSQKSNHQIIYLKTLGPSLEDVFIELIRDK